MIKAKKQAAVRDEVASLQSMTLSELRMLWAARFGAPPKQRSVELLRRVLAWRLQAEAFGGLDAVTVRLLGSERPLVMVAEQPGTRLARDYAGKRHEVVMLVEGVLYDGATYGSLSEVARLITGQRWNGPRFFGLRRENVR
ncbi:DUF2924 domain-containing protein [Sphingorhabdus pulchriflava]|uniref:DUF2924 domain-containing protein n=1 Tax=Sphingorhabdus pulchriflava TaxID=2292257 RepID=A0A371B4M3_9SPHN|nr:DUF2924 domain-containing protein [Sphingorhabdus pulchriflava]RDV02452.1 DUF2924 domain-containing protein [Sphingorhabdus pulchriflava]